MARETKSQSNKNYYEKNKEKIMKHLYEERLCKYCNRFYRLCKLSSHNKTMKHINNVKKEIRLKE